MNNQVKYILNPAYYLRNDIKRAVIGDHGGIYESSEAHAEDVNSVLHPKIAQMLSFFDGERTLQECLDAIAAYFGVTPDDIAPIIEKYIGNPKAFIIPYGKHCIHVPQNVLVEKKDHKKFNRYTPEQFEVDGEVDLSHDRYNKPIQCTLELLFKCYTDCIYCYADRSRRDSDEVMSLEQILHIIREARSIGIVSFDTNGGEVLMHKHYREIFRELAANGYFPLISTKMPVKRDVLEFLKSIGMLKFQISIDSLNPEILARTLKVGPDYRDRILDTMDQLEELEFPWQTNTILTKYNSSLNEIKLLLNKLFSFKNLKEIRINPAGYSLYKSADHYNEIKPSAEAVERIEEYVRTLPETQQNRIILGGVSTAKDMTRETRAELFRDRSICSGNHSSFFILPDGKVTICEELYWHPRFIIGDLTKQSIMEIWNSPKAVNLYYITQDEFREESACKTCDSFNKCRRPVGICWKEALMAYGKDNWDYPDPGCPFAPAPINETFLK